MTSFLDTNVLVYAFDRSEPAKMEVAQRLLADPDADYVISAQVLSEFYVATTRKLNPPLDHLAALEAMEYLMRLPVVAVDDRLVAYAVTLAEEEPLSLWDAQIVAAAVRAGCEEILTEDLNDGQLIAGVLVRNPFV
ncbi:MAG: PIN domain-containing protein [Acidimicrobiia bacterium]|nr:PIN domain-containing protein [Acidimicrobiia bacterium]